MTAINVKGIPEDLSKFILRVQCQVKGQKSLGKYSQSQAVIHIIREYKKLIEK